MAIVTSRVVSGRIQNDPAYLALEGRMGRRDGSGHNLV